MANTPKDDPANYPALGRWLMFLDEKKNVTRIVYGLYILCAGLIAADFFYYKKAYFSLEKLTGFYALYGFFMCIGLVICAKVMRRFLTRPEEYYAPYDVEVEDYPEEGLDRESVND